MIAISSVESWLYGSLEWLKRHRIVNGSAVLLYTLFILFMHDPMVSVSVALMNYFTLPVYNMIVAGIAVCVIIILFVYVISRYVRSPSDTGVKLIYLGAILTLLGIHWFVMLEMNIEVVHALLYGGLLILMYPLVGRLGGAVLFCLPIMLLDEWFQYQILYEEYVEYFEINDVILDMLGAGLFVVLLWIAGVKNFSNKLVWWKRAEIWLVASVITLYTFLLATCVLAISADSACDHTIMLMSELKNFQSFWQVHPNTKAIYHVIGPVEGVFYIIGLSLFLFLLDRRIWMN